MKSIKWLRSRGRTIERKREEQELGSASLFQRGEEEEEVERACICIGSPVRFVVQSLDAPGALLIVSISMPPPGTSLAPPLPLPLHDLGRSATTPRLARPRNQRHETPWKSNGERSEDRSAADPRPIKGVCTPPRRGVLGRIMKKAFGRYDTSLRGKDFSTRISPRHRASTYSPALLRPRWALGKLNYFESFVLSRGLVLSRAGPMGGRRVDEVVARDCFFLLCIKIRV